MFHERTQITRNILVDPVEFLGQESVQWPPESSTSTAAPRSTPNGPIVVPSENQLVSSNCFRCNCEKEKKNIPIIPYSSLNPVRIVASCVVIIFPHQTASGRRGGSPMVDPGRVSHGRPRASPGHDEGPHRFHGAAAQIPEDFFQLVDG